jgi:hypothetical protein
VLSLAVWVVAAWFVARPAGAAGADPATGAVSDRIVVTVGFDGAIRPGVPVPVDIRTPPMPAGGPARLLIDTTALAPQPGRVTVSTVVPFDAAAGAVEHLRAPIVIQDVRFPLHVRVLADGRPVAAADVWLDPSRVAGRLVVLVSDVRAGLGVLRRLDERVVDAYVGADALPARWQEYSAVDLLVLRNLDPVRLSDAQRGALLTWVRLGGRLVVVAQPGVPLPEFLAPVLPARAGVGQTMIAPATLAGAVGGAAPPAPIPAVVLTPKPDAAVLRAGGVPIAAKATAGDGDVIVWGIDPTVPPLADWAGRTRLWEQALGAPPASPVDPTVVAGHLTPAAPADRGTHFIAGLLMAGYVGGLALLRRRRPTPDAAVLAAAAAAAAVVVLGGLAAGARARSTALTQVAVLEQAAGAPVARAELIAAAAVPYGGPFEIAAPAGAAAAPVAMLGDLRVRWLGDEVTFAAEARSDTPWIFQALTAVPLGTAARYDPATRSIAVDLGTARLFDAAVWWHGFVFPLGDLPPGRSMRTLPDTGWRRASESLSDESAVARIFRARAGEPSGPLAGIRRPVLAGEWTGPRPVFTLVPPEAAGADGAATHRAVLVIPVAGPAPEAAP